jgi:hypothetical protein
VEGHARESLSATCPLNRVRTYSRTSSADSFTVPGLSAQRRHERQRLRFAAPDQIVGAPMGAQILIEEQVLDSLAEGPVVGDPLVQFESTISWMTCSTFWSNVRRTFSRVLTRAAASSAASSSSFSIIWPSGTRCSGPRLRPKRSFSSAMIRDNVSSCSRVAVRVAFPERSVAQPGPDGRQGQFPHAGVDARRPTGSNLGHAHSAASSPPAGQRSAGPAPATLCGAMKELGITHSRG